MSGSVNSDYRSAFEYSPDPIGVIRDGIFVDCNRAMLNMLALKDKADFVGGRPGETFSPQRQPDGAVSSVKAKGYLQQCIDRGRTSFAWTSKRSNGDLLSVQVLLQALQGSESQVIVVYIHDVSQLKASQQAALSRKAYLQELLESSPVAFMVSDLNTGLICKVNRRGRLMLGLSDLAWGDIRADDLLANRSDRIRFLRLLRKHGEASGEIMLKRLDGTLLHSDVTWRYNPGNNGELLCWAVDISDFKRAEQELELSRDQALKADDAKSEFLSRMSHELRTPMNAILGFGQLLQLDKDNLTVEQNDSVEHILSAGEHLLELIKDMLDFSRVNSGHISLTIRKVSTRRILRGSIALIRPLANESRISVSAQTGSLPDVLADSHWLQQVLVNLLSNAVKYNRRGGTVSVSSEARTGGKLRIHVKDSGEGIRPQDAHRLFKPFERVSATHPEIEGTGIGLALCKQLIELMGGCIGFESEPGIGSDFWIELPALENSEETAVSAGAKPFKILYIEDHLANIGPMVEAARRLAGCELITATNARAGISLAQLALPDLIVMDVNLAGAAVVEVIEQLKVGEATRDLPIYGLISDAETRGTLDGHLAGCSQLLSSPLQPDALVRLIGSRE